MVAGREMDAWELLECDWAETQAGYSLHHVAVLDHAGRFDEERQGWGKTTCGIWTNLSVPGVFARMGWKRCQNCCRMLGVVPGVGSPKNDPELRAFLKERLSVRGSIPLDEEQP